MLKELGFPAEQQSELAAYCLLALANISTPSEWSKAENPLIGITPIIDWVKQTYGKRYAANTRETFRRHAMHQFVRAGLVLYNPDNPGRAVNSPNAVYQIEPSALDLIRKYGSDEWASTLNAYLAAREMLQSRLHQERSQELVPVQINPELELRLSPGGHSKLIKQIIEEFGARFLPGGQLVYVGDTGDKWGYYNAELLEHVVGSQLNAHGKMPDAIFYLPERKWLVLIEAVTSHGPMNAKRHFELTALFGTGRSGLVFVTAFPTRKLMSRYVQDIAWETEVWVAESPSHLIHFNGSRFLGPYDG